MRRIYLDLSPGEERGLVTLNGLPERLLIERKGQAEPERLGARSVARIARIERALGMTFLELPEGATATAPMVAGLAEGGFAEIEITAEARRGKAASATLRASAEGPIRLIEAAAPLMGQLRAFAPQAPIVEGPEARRMTDEAQDAVLATVHALPGGGSLSIEPTRALIAVDVDVGARRGSDARRVARQTNLAAIDAAARLLRLKGLGGLVVIDLAGKGHDGAAISQAAKTAFAPDGPQVSIGPVSRFGLFELALPRHRRPALEQLSDVRGAITPEAAAQDLLRAMEREGRANPGAQLCGRASAPVIEAASLHSTGLVERLGPRFSFAVEPGLPSYEVSIL